MAIAHRHSRPIHNLVAMSIVVVLLWLFLIVFHPWAARPPAASCRHGLSRNWTPVLSSKTATASSSLMSISRMSRGGDRRLSWSLRHGGLPEFGVGLSTFCLFWNHRCVFSALVTSHPVRILIPFVMTKGRCHESTRFSDCSGADSRWLRTVRWVLRQGKGSASCRARRN